MAQIRVLLARPHQLANGRMIIDFDPAVFGPVTAVDVFSTMGDQIGVANIRDRHVEVQFTSPSGGIGRLPGLPIATVMVPVLASATPGVMGSISLTSGDVPWKDAQGYQYLPATQPGRMKVGGSLSIDSVTPGGGLLPAGSRVRIAGRGFTASSAVQIEGVVVGSTAFAGPQAIDVTLGAPADLTAKRVVVQNPDGSQADFYSALRGSLRARASGLLIQPIFPLRTYPGAHIGKFGTWFALQNQNPEPVDVAFVVTTTSRFGTSVNSSTTTLSAGGIGIVGPDVVTTSSTITLSVYPTVPIRMMLLGPPGLYSEDSLVRNEFPSLVAPTAAQISVSWDRQPSCSNDPFFGLIPQPLCLPWLLGSPPPEPRVLTVRSSGPSTTFTADVATADSGQWLSVSPAQGATCPTAASACPDSSKITLTLAPSSLSGGDYTGAITITPTAPNYSPETITLLFRVTNSIISVQGPDLRFITDSDGTPSPPLSLEVASTGDPAAFSATLRTSREVWGNWLSVTPMEGTTPSTLTVTVNPSALPTGQGGALGYITITGPANSVTRMVLFADRQRLPPPRMYTSAGERPLVFWAKAGITTPATRFIAVAPYSPDDVAVATDSGGAWLTAQVSRDIINNSTGLSVTVDPSGLKAGTYFGAITVASTAHSEYAPAQIAVTLLVWAEPPPVSVAPASLLFTVPSGSASGYYDSADINAHTLAVSSAGMPVESTVATSTADGNDWLAVLPPYSYVPYGGVYLRADARNLPPGTYEGAVKIVAPPGSAASVTVPVSLNVTPAVPPLPQPGPPLGVSIVNAASLAVGAVAPGEILSIFGLNIGPSIPAGLSLDADDKVATDLNGARLLFEDVPAPLLYASATQVNAVVPYEVAGKASVTVRVELNGKPATVGGVSVAPSAPAFFTLDSSGQGQANAFNEDNSTNGPANPASRGSIIRILATGVGQTTPPSVTGEITPDGLKKPLLPVSVKIGGIDATVEDAGSAPGQVAGVFQLRVRVPQGVASGSALPVVLMVGSARSRDGVTVAVK